MASCGFDETTTSRWPVGAVEIGAQVDGRLGQVLPAAVDGDRRRRELAPGRQQLVVVPPPLEEVLVVEPPRRIRGVDVDLERRVADRRDRRPRRFAEGSVVVSDCGNAISAGVDSPTSNGQPSALPSVWPNWSRSDAGRCTTYRVSRFVDPLTVSVLPSTPIDASSAGVIFTWLSSNDFASRRVVERDGEAGSRAGNRRRSRIGCP